MRDMLTTANYFGSAPVAVLMAAVLLAAVPGCSGPPRYGTYQPNAIESQLMAEVAVQRGERARIAQEHHHARAGRSPTTSA